MILGAVRCAKSTSGSKTSGLAPDSRTFQASSLFTERWSGWPQWAHSLLISTTSDSLRKRPCTKGVAIASSPQAANRRSPLLKRKRWGVLSVVTGKTQLTSPASFKTRKNRRFCNSARISTTRSIGIVNLLEIASGARGFPPLRGSSLATKFRIRRWSSVIKLKCEEPCCCALSR